MLPRVVGRHDDVLAGHAGDAAPQPADYLTVPAGGTWVYTVDLSSDFAFTATADYAIRLVAADPLLVLDTARLTFEGQVVPALHAEIARAARACEGEAMHAEISYRKWKASHAMAARGGEDYSVVVTVRDTGPGIRPDQIEKLFEPYFTTKEKGTGLGLPLARKLVEAHRGTLTLESKPGQTVFRLSLPTR